MYMCVCIYLYLYIYIIYLKYKIVIRKINCFHVNINYILQHVLPNLDHPMSSHLNKWNLNSGLIPESTLHKLFEVYINFCLG